MAETTFDKSLIELDPFGFLINYTSAIKPLGGTSLSPDPKYAFHTPYVKYRAGRIIYRIRFEGLVATHGELSIHINGFDPDSGRDAVLVNSVRMPLARYQGELSISILGVAGVSYAAYGFISDATDATAEAMFITAEELGAEDIGDTAPDSAHPTQYGATDLSHPVRMVNSFRPVLADPVSQPLTEGQLSEPAFSRWAGVLPKDGDRRTQWQAAYILQTLDRYGMLDKGAKGLALHASDGVLGPLISARGCSVAHGSANPHEPITDLHGFDFLWSIGTLNAMHDGQTAYFVEQALRTLRPGGYAVFTFDMSSGEAIVPPDPATGIAPFPQMLIERLALTIMSRAHDIAQLNFGTSDAGDMPLYAAAADQGTPTVPFGLIVRKR